MIPGRHIISIHMDVQHTYEQFINSSTFEQTVGTKNCNYNVIIMHIFLHCFYLFNSINY